MPGMAHGGWYSPGPQASPPALSLPLLFASPPAPLTEALPPALGQGARESQPAHGSQMHDPAQAEGTPKKGTRWTLGQRPPVPPFAGFQPFVMPLPRAPQPRRLPITPALGLAGHHGCLPWRRPLTLGRGGAVRAAAS